MSVLVIKNKQDRDAAMKLMAETKSPLSAKVTKSPTVQLGTVIKDIDGVRKFAEDVGIKDMDVTADSLQKYSTILPTVISQEEKDRDGDIIELGGMDLVEYAKNPVMLWGHDQKELAIGNGLLTTKVGDQIRSLAAFAAKEINPAAYTIGQMYAHGINRAFSIGFMGEGELIVEKNGMASGVRWTKSELLEYSAVNVQSNRNALLQARSFGIDTQPLFADIEKQLDEMELIAVGRAEAEELWKILSPTKSFAAADFTTAILAGKKELAALRRKVREEEFIRKATSEVRPTGVINWKRVAALLAKKSPELVQDAIELSTYEVADEEGLAEAEKQATEDIEAAIEDGKDDTKIDEPVDAGDKPKPDAKVDSGSSGTDTPPAKVEGSESAPEGGASTPTESETKTKALELIKHVVTKRLSAG